LKDGTSLKDPAAEASSENATVNLTIGVNGTSVRNATPPFSNQRQTVVDLDSKFNESIPGRNLDETEDSFQTNATGETSLDSRISENFTGSVIQSAQTVRTDNTTRSDQTTLSSSGYTSKTSVDVNRTSNTASPAFNLGTATTNETVASVTQHTASETPESSNKTDQTTLSSSGYTSKTSIDVNHTSNTASPAFNLSTATTNETVASVTQRTASETLESSNKTELGDQNVTKRGASEFTQPQSLESPAVSLASHKIFPLLDVPTYWL
jgi:uncharacterized protein YegP (UPF0339 family)